MQQIDDEKILVALCCGRTCRRGEHSGMCHRGDFVSEARRIRQLINDWLAEQTEKEGA